MKDKILLKILANFFVAVMLISVITPCIAVDTSANSTSSNRTEEFDATVIPIPSPFYAKQFPLDAATPAQFHLPKLFDPDMPMNRDGFWIRLREVIISIILKIILDTSPKETCSSFVDANGKGYYDWIPAIRLE